MRKHITKKRFLLIGTLLLVATISIGNQMFQSGETAKQVTAPTAPSPEPVALSGLQIYGTNWGETLATDGTGFYNDLVKLALSGFDVRYDIRPYRRAKALFLRGAASCLYPSNIQLLIDGQEIESPDGFIDTDGFLVVKVFVFSKPGTKPPSTVAEINHKSVAYAMGSRVPFFLRNANADFIAVSDETDKAQMLLSGRVDLMSAAMPDAKFVFDGLGTPMPPFDANYLLNDTVVRITCHDTPGTRAFVAAFNEHLASLGNSGALSSLISSAGLDADLYLPKK
ncbi:MAG: hypothetical protein HWE25_08745 [Alphaproteobacteria bacterium]|nr:hypothetical protein [Alphaproteobacteria bacterium]